MTIQWSSPVVANLAAIMCSGFMPISQDIRGGWLATEVNNWLWFRELRSPAESTQLIHDNMREFANEGKLRTAIQNGPDGPFETYLLTWKQVMHFCMLSDAPRAKDVREVIIKTVVNGMDIMAGTVPRRA